MPPCKYHGAETLGIARSSQQIMLFQQRNGCSNVLKLQFEDDDDDDDTKKLRSIFPRHSGGKFEEDILRKVCR